MEGIDKTKIEAGNSAPDASVGNETLNHASGGSHSSDSGTPPTKLVMLRSNNISSIELGNSEDGDSWGKFRRIPTKHVLIEELEWKPADPFPLRKILLIGAFSVAFCLYVGFKLNKELRVSFGPKVVPLQPVASTGTVKVLNPPKDPSESGFNAAISLVKNSSSTKHYGNTNHARVAAASLSLLLELAIQLKLEDSLESALQKNGEIRVNSCCHDGTYTTAFLVNVVGANYGPENEILRTLLVKYVWIASMKCVEGIDSLAKKSIRLVVLCDGKPEIYLLGESMNDRNPKVISKADAQPIFQKEFNSWQPSKDPAP